MSYLGSYPELIRTFLAAGYRVCDFHTLATPSGELVLRHDIDFDCAAAKRIAEQEVEVGVRSTFFFLLRSASYNLFEKANTDAVKAIRDMGHEVSVHFDPTLYDHEAGLLEERDVFEKLFNVRVRIVSFHRPSLYFQSLTEPYNGMDHTYEPKYTKEITYLSDSQGAFRFGHPLESEAFRARRSIQLLTHPIWWTHEGASNIEILERFLEGRMQASREHVAKNCIPYRAYLEKP